MWILDARYRGEIELWVKGRNMTRIREKYRPCFYLHLPDPHAHIGMLDALSSKYGAEECDFKTIHGLLNGYRVYAGREVAEAIEKQSHFTAKLYNVDVRTEQRFMAEKKIVPCCSEFESRFDTDFEIPLSTLEIKIPGNPCIDKDVPSIVISDGCEKRLEGSERCVLKDLSDQVEAYDPDVILFKNADFWMHLILKKIRDYCLDATLSRTGFFSKLEEKSYWSYGKVNYRAGALIPEGRILIDTEASFNYKKGGLKGILLASRLTGLSPNLTSRFTPGTLVSSYENYEAVARGIAVPFRKSDPERLRGFAELRAKDRGGMMFQPKPGVHERTYQLDFTSMYPSIIVKHNLSPETIANPDLKGFLSEVLAPLLELRIRTKNLKKSDPEYSGLDMILKWMLITCFGYTGYRNAKFGNIEVHERITFIARDILLNMKDIAEEMGFEVLHGIVDCVWVRGEPIMKLKETVENRTGLLIEVEAYDWLVFLPMVDGGGAYNRYYGRLSDGSIKTRGMMMNRGNTPAYIVRMQSDMLDIMKEAQSFERLKQSRDKIEEVHQKYLRELRCADVKELVINSRISNTDYQKNCPQRSALDAYRRQGVEIEPGMVIGFVIRDAKRWIVDTEWEAREFDVRYYSELLEKAWKEIAFALDFINKKKDAYISRLSGRGYSSQRPFLESA